MPKNLEVKSRIQSSDHAIAIAQALGASYEGELHQVDTYFMVRSGRLKLREINQATAELIFYNRPEIDDQRISAFEIYPCSNPKQFKQILEQAIGVKAVVEKRRLLYLYGSTRIHIDTVVNLGSFLEFEVPVLDSESEAKRTMDLLVNHFEIKESDYIRHSYVDLMLGKNA